MSKQVHTYRKVQIENDKADHIGELQFSDDDSVLDGTRIETNHGHNDKWCENKGIIENLHKDHCCQLFV